MKKTIRIITAIVLTIIIILCSLWYLFVYDREFTRDILLSCARTCESQGSHNAAAWLYNLAYNQSSSSDAVAVELAQQYKLSGNFTKAEYTLYNAISDGGGVDVYIALSKLYVEQDKLLDAVTMLNSVSNTQIKEQLDALRPAAPVSTPEQGFYNQYISVTLQSGENVMYYSVNGQYPTTFSDPYNAPIPLSDGENIIHALAVNEEGLVSPLSTFGYTVGGVIEKIDFDDDVLEAEIRSALNFDENKELYTNDLWAITSFTVPETAKNYSILKKMVFLKSLTVNSGVSEELHNLSTLSNLTELKITNTAVSEDVIEAIGSLPQLKKLTLSGCSLTNISPLSKTTNVSFLDLSNNAIRNIDALSSMSKLQELNLNHNALTDLTALSANTALTSVDVSHNSITSLAALSTLTALTRLDANTNSLTELGEIGKLTVLSFFSVANNKLTDISQLVSCTALTDLDISSNALTDISGLSSLKNISTFNFSHNQVTAIPAWSSDCALVSIDGSYNELTSLKNLGGLKKLNVVSMDYNKGITSLSALTKCPSLVKVNVYGTGITDVKALTSQSIVVNYNPIK